MMDVRKAMSEDRNLYVSSVEGQLVSRYGTRSLFIGARFDQESGKLAWQPEEVVLIPEQEALFYAREYRRLLKEGALRKRTVEDFRKQQAASQGGGSNTPEG
jgi:hypothetical protein